MLEDDGHRQLVEVDQAAAWKFLWFSGTLSVCVLVDQDRRKRMVSLKYIAGQYLHIDVLLFLEHGKFQSSHFSVFGGLLSRLISSGGF